jgi:hypothetical protein
MEIPTLSLDIYLADSRSPQALDQARQVAESLINIGAVIIRDTRVSKAANDRFLDVLEDYFAQDDSVLKEDERPEVGYQVVCLLSISSCRT